MDNNIISKILADYPEAWKDAKRFKALLLDFLPEDKRLRNLIVISVEERIPDDIFQSKAGDSLQENAYVKRLVNAVGCSDDDARIVVNLWIASRSSCAFEKQISRMYCTGLPAYAELSEAQLEIINLPLNKDYVIKGAHGTGKTTIAIYRALQASRDGKVLYLVWNRTGLIKVNRILSSLGSFGKNIEVETCISWITDLLKANGISIPRNDSYDIDWKDIDKQSMELKLQSAPFIVVDDTEKMPLELLRIVNRISKNTTCMITPADETCGQLSVVDTLICLCVEAPFRLTQNIRNTKEIIDVAKLYASDYLPDSKIKSGRKPMMIKVQVADQCQCIAEIIKKNIEKRIAIITKQKAIRSIYSELQDLVGDVCEIRTLPNEKFDDAGVAVCSRLSSTGMDFDIVILPMFDRLSYENEIETREIIYELICKAKRELYFLYSDDKLDESRFSPMAPLVKFRQLCERNTFVVKNQHEGVLQDDYNDMLIEDLELTSSVYYSLKRAGVERVSDLRKMTEEDILAIRGCGRKTVGFIQDRLNVLGYSLKKSEAEENEEALAYNAIDSLEIDQKKMDRIKLRLLQLAVENKTAKRSKRECARILNHIVEKELFDN